jgi:glyoxylase-like metal-dependent hydrolase (beta-lactamase superfamily II)
MLPDFLEVLVRGWMHGNVVAVRGAVPTLVDSGYETGADETLAFARRALEGEPAQLVLTHVHADHAGGIGHMVGATGAPVHGHEDAAALVEPTWDPSRLWLAHTGQSMPRFRVDHLLGEQVRMGDRDWRVLHTPGHATGGVSIYEPLSRVLITGDALWRRGFGVLDPWTDGPGVFDQTEEALDRIAALDVAVVVPGHGQPFTDVEAALEEARARLAHLRQHPERLKAQMVRNLAGFLRMARPVEEEELREMVLRIAATVEMPEKAALAELARVLAS